jgi:hypothetical protein
MLWAKSHVDRQYIQQIPYAPIIESYTIVQFHRQAHVFDVTCSYVLWKKPSGTLPAHLALTITCAS